MRYWCGQFDVSGGYGGPLALRAGLPRTRGLAALEPGLASDSESLVGATGAVPAETEKADDDGHGVEYEPCLTIG